VNLELEVRQVAAEACGLSRIDGIFFDSTLQGLGADADTILYFWSAIERKYSIAVTRAQRGQLSTIGQIVHYLKIRLRDDRRASA
jgi:Phosphopantetheine attachment site